MLTQTRGTQVLITAPQSVGKLKPTKVPTEQRKNKHLFRSAALIHSRFAQLPTPCKPESQMIDIIYNQVGLFLSITLRHSQSYLGRGRLALGEALASASLE